MCYYLSLLSVLLFIACSGTVDNSHEISSSVEIAPTSSNKGTTELSSVLDSKSQRSENTSSSSDKLSSDIIMSSVVNPKKNHLLINEFIASNKSTGNPLPLFLDQSGNYSDWVELYNGGTEPIQLGEFFISDNREELYSLSLRDSILSPGEHYVFFATIDKIESNVSFKDHIPFKLSYRCGDELFLIRKADRVVVDSVIFSYNTENYDYLLSNESFGRLDDGSAIWGPQSIPTPSGQNKGVIKSKTNKGRDTQRYNASECSL